MALLDTGNGLYDAISKSRLCSAVKNFGKIVEGKRPSVDADDSLPFCREKDGNAFVLFGHNDWKLNVGETGSLWKMRGWRSAKNVFLWMENTK